MAVQRHSPAGSLVLRAGLALVLVSLGLLAWFSLAAQHRGADEAREAQAASRLATSYQDARFWVSQNESLERKYRVEPSATVLARHATAGRRLVADLRSIERQEPSAAGKAGIARLHGVHTAYEAATKHMFAAVREGRITLSEHLDATVTDPAFSKLETAVYGGAAAASARALRLGTKLHEHDSLTFEFGVIAILLAVALVGLTSAIARRHRRAIAAVRAAELERLEQMVVTDPLTGLRNHRAFQEDLEREMARAARAGSQLTLAMLDLDDLKSVNDEHGHQAGDECLRTLATRLSAASRAGDRAYRVGGDEFALILPDTGQWDAFRLAQRLSRAADGEPGASAHATAGIAQALPGHGRDELIREADLAMLSAKRAGQEAALFTPDMHPASPRATLEEDPEHIRSLAAALAMAVDVKDSYTQSHSQTVANLCGAIAVELGIGEQRLGMIRVAGLLHDVGKIGIPDAILKKPGKLTEEEFELMKTHAALGESIIRAADMPKRATWVRHHHERIDGNGYPDGLAGEQIPLESRIIHVADAFEAMISDRPYRAAPGERFALAELRRHAGTQFDPAVVDALLRVLGARPLSTIVVDRAGRARMAHAAVSV